MNTEGLAPRRWQSPLPALMSVLVVHLVLWAMMNPRSFGTGASPSSAGSLAVLVVFMVTFGALSLNLINRLAAVAVGAIACLLLGTLLEFYFPSDAIRYLISKHEPLVMLAGISLVTSLLMESGWFKHLASRAVRSCGGDRLKVTMLLCLLTFGLSMVLNNLATIFVVIPLSLRFATAARIDPVPLVVGEIIASNLGGASTMVGDFPNMLIASETGLRFDQFFFRLAPICLLQLVILLAYLSSAFRGPRLNASQLRTVLDQLCPRQWNQTAASRGTAILAGMIIGFLVCGWMGWPPEIVSVLFGHLALFAGAVPIKTLVRRVCWDDIGFFACLFLMVGAVDACGILDGLSATLGHLWRQSPTWGVLALTWSAALLTCILNAGPSTALFIHLIPTGLAGVAGGNIVWWALSLGVCAGSSATLTGATAGPVAVSMLEQQGYNLSFNRFARTGFPIMLVFLVVSSVYLVILVNG